MSDTAQKYTACLSLAEQGKFAAFFAVEAAFMRSLGTP